MLGFIVIRRFISEQITLITADKSENVFPTSHKFIEFIHLYASYSHFANESSPYIIKVMSQNRIVYSATSLCFLWLLQQPLVCCLSPTIICIFHACLLWNHIQAEWFNSAYQFHLSTFSAASPASVCDRGARKALSTIFTSYHMTYAVVDPVSAFILYFIRFTIFCLKYKITAIH